MCTNPPLKIGPNKSTICSGSHICLQKKLHSCFILIFLRSFGKWKGSICDLFFYILSEKHLTWGWVQQCSEVRKYWETDEGKYRRPGFIQTGPFFVTVMFQHLKLNMGMLTASLHTVCHSTAGHLWNYFTHWKSPKKEQKITGTWPHLIGFFFSLRNIFTCSPLNISKWAG